MVNWTNLAGRCIYPIDDLSYSKYLVGLGVISGLRGETLTRETLDDMLKGENSLEVLSQLSSRWDLEFSRSLPKNHIFKRTKGKRSNKGDQITLNDCGLFLEALGFPIEETYLKSGENRTRNIGYQTLFVPFSNSRNSLSDVVFSNLENSNFSEEYIGEIFIDFYDLLEQ